jgi:predicted P-loop ATPase/GTPase
LSKKKSCVLILKIDFFFFSFCQSKLQEAIQDSSQPPDQAFQSLFGKEKPGIVRCFVRTATPSMKKKNEEIAISRNNMKVK